MGSKLEYKYNYFFVALPVLFLVLAEPARFFALVVVLFLPPRRGSFSGEIMGRNLTFQ